MTVPEAAALGVLQGVTEFLPVSSDGHLALAQLWLVGEQKRHLLFDLVVHLGTLLAIVILLRERVFGLVRAGLGLLPGVSSQGRESDRRWLGLIVLGSLPTALIGLGLRKLTMDLQGSAASVGALLCTTGAILVFANRMRGGERGPRELGVADALVVGAAQGLAVLPGLSRSASTVAAGLALGARPDTAVEFSMMLSVPAILGAGLFELLGTPTAELRASALPYLAGFATAFAAGLVSLRALQLVVRRRLLLPFAAYCVLLGAGAIALG